MELTTKHFKAIALLYEGKSKTQIAKELKITAGTLNRWTNDPDFKTALVAMATQQIGELVPQAVNTLGQVMADDMAKPADRLNAAKAVLDYARITDRKDMEQEITLRVEYV